MPQFISVVSDRETETKWIQESCKIRIKRDESIIKKSGSGSAKNECRSIIPNQRGIGGEHTTFVQNDFTLGCPLISLGSETKRNKSENERSEIAK